jgi:hypothetical protein
MPAEIVWPGTEDAFGLAPGYQGDPKSSSSGLVRERLNSHSQIRPSLAPLAAIYQPLLRLEALCALHSSAATRLPSSAPSPLQISCTSVHDDSLRTRWLHLRRRFWPIPFWLQWVPLLIDDTRVGSELSV